MQGTDLSCILTYPFFCSEGAQGLLRQAALRSGFPYDALTLITEEAATRVSTL
jgi:hypothetical protein